MSKFVFTNVNPFIETGAGEAYYFTYKNEEYFVECWASHNSGGQEIYTATEGRPCNPIADKDEEKWEKALEAARTAFSKAWDTHIEPHFAALHEDFLKHANL